MFGVFFWFVVLSALGLGPAGAVLYRMAEFASRYWAFKSRTLGRAGQRAADGAVAAPVRLIDHVPARLTAFGFAVVGNFEEAVNGWRRDAGLWQHAERRHHPRRRRRRGRRATRRQRRAGRHARPLARPSTPVAAPEAADAAGSTPGVPPQLGHLRSVVGLVWRSVVLWMLLLALLSLANLIG